MSEYSINCHSSIRIKNNNVIYIDPFKISDAVNDADIILITHEHFDHFSPEDIRKLTNEHTVLVMPFTCRNAAEKEGFNTDSIIFVEPGDSLTVKGTTVKTVCAYNEGKMFHPRTNKWVGYIINDGDEDIYIAGDTDAVAENENIKCDTAFVPVGGTYTMTAQEAACFINKIRPAKAIPTHYGSVAGAADDGKKFADLVDKEINTEIII